MQVAQPRSVADREQRNIRVGDPRGRQMEIMRSIVGKLVYGALFTVALPLLLVVWAIKTHDLVDLPALHSLPWGIGAVGLGVLLMGLGMASLWFVGGGLPMNAFPPPRYVSVGIYGLFSHPIYLGFSMACAGTAIAAGSASGLWLVSTTVILAIAALVLGYELPDMQARFGHGQRLFPPDDQSAPSGMERIRCYLTVLLPWFLIYEAFVVIGVPRDAEIAFLTLENRVPVLPWTGIFYGSVYVMVLLVPWIVRTRHDLRLFSSRALISMVIVFPLYLAVPLIAPPRAFSTTGRLAELLRLDRSMDGAAAAFPSYHVIWAFLAAEALGRSPWQKRLWRAWAVLVSVSCVTTGMHAMVDVIVGVFVSFAIIRIDRVWFFLRNSSEIIANSWQEWRMGPARVINHGAYAAGGVFMGIWVIDTLLGPGKSAIPVAIFLGGSIGAALWAQVIEGSPALLRPLGFYGGMLGTSAGGIAAAWLTRTSIWPVLAVLVVSAPWIQGIGRLRCLVQGCCHGRPTSHDVGIRYTHPRSRVWRVVSLRGVPVHATPLYSLLWNVVVALVVTRIYLLHASAAMVGGIYLILSGAGRFVEEAYRGEPQTPIFWRLRLYQWVAVATVLVGALITTVSNSPPTLRPALHTSSVFVALACGIGAWFLTGVDFPESNRRFARLT
jgi:Prolipoprotein diacylglyceryl transferase/PAP2 superfamily/Phospholipid methyltransferase